MSPASLSAARATSSTLYPRRKISPPSGKYSTRSIRTGSWRGEFQNRKKDGTPFFTHAHISLLKAEGKKLYISVQEDITARRRAQETMRRQAELLDLAYDAILALDPQHRISYWNQGAEALYGWTKSQALARPAHELLATRFPEPLTDIEKQVIEQGHWEGELVNTTRDGRTVTVNSHWTVKRDEAGRVVAILEINRDITAQKRGEEEALRLASFPLLNPNPVMEVDEDGGVVYANPAAQSVASGLKLKGGVKGLVPEDLKEYFARAQHGGPREYVLDVTVKEKAYAVTLYLPHDLPTARLYFLDITARKEAEAALIQAKEEWERTFDAVPDAIFILDREHRVLRMNKAMAEFLAKPPEEVIGYSCYQVAHGLDEVPDFCPHAKVMATGEAASAVVEESGRVFDVAVSPIFGPDGTLLGGVHVARDITERHQMEGALRESEERFRNMANAIPQLAWIAESDGYIFWYNHRWYDYTGTTPEEMAGWGWQSVHDPEALPGYWSGGGLLSPPASLLTWFFHCAARMANFASF